MTRGMFSKPSPDLHGYEMESLKIIGPEKRGSQYVYRMGKEILPQNMSVQEVRGMVTRARMEGKVYPPTAIRRYTHRAYQRLETRTVPEVNGMGCFLKKDRKAILPGELIGVYEGIMDAKEGAYCVQLPETIIDGDPSLPINSMMSRINDDFHHPERRNCNLGPGGVIIATKRIGPGEQLLLDYGKGYDWDGVKVHGVRALGPRIRKAAERLGVDGFDVQIEEISDELRALPIGWRKAISTKSWGQLVTRAIDGKLGDHTHRYRPGRKQLDTFGAWLERLMTCKPFARRTSYTTWKAWETEDWDWTQDVAPIRFGRMPRQAHVRMADMSDEKDTERLLPLEADQGGRPSLLKESDEEGEETGGDSPADIPPPPRCSPIRVRTVRATGSEEGEGKSKLLRILEYNVNTLTEEKEEEIVDIVVTRKVDCTILIDTRKSRVQTRHTIARLRDALGPEYYVGEAPVDPETQAAQRVGGQLWIVDVRTLRKPRFKCVTERGALAYIDATVGKDERIRIIGTYWPLRNTSPTSMWQQLGGEQTIPTLKRYIGELVTEARGRNSTVVVAGDFNSDINKSDNYGLEEARKMWGLHHITSTTEASWRNKKSQTRIDYVMAGGDMRGSDMQMGGPVATPTNHTDHLPVLGLLLYWEADSTVRAARFELDRDLSRDNVVYQERLKQTYKKWELPEDPIEALEYVTTETVRTIRNLQGWKKRKRWRDGWSPTMAGLQTALQMAIRLRRHLRGEHKYSRWRSDQFQAKRKGLCYRWRATVKKLIKATTVDGILLRRALLTEQKYGYATIRTMTYASAQSAIDGIVRSIAKHLQGRLRKDMRMRISEAVANRERAREAGRTGKVLRSVLGHHGKQRDRYLLEQIRSDEGVLADAKTIHDITTEHFRRWFAVPSWSEEYLGARDYEEGFVKRWTLEGIPQHLLTRAWKALEPKLDENVSLEDIPTLAEFKGAMKRMKRDSAPGITGLSYNMMRTWPDEIVEVVYRGIKARWEKGQVPDEWRWKWLAPIPKAADPHLDDLRPLGLLEPLRKVWMSIFVRRIWKFWTTMGVVNEAQHGSVPGRCTATAVAQLIDGLETAKELKSTVYVSSWDIRRAFDSVSKPLMQWALRRLGVPTGLIRMMSEVDRGGGTIVRTPYAIQAMKQGLRKDDLSFQQERGIPQGDVASPMIWVAVFDIVLDALALAEGYFLHERQERHTQEGW